MQKSDTKVLVVDDEELIRNLFKNSLQKWNYKVDLAHDGQMALQKCSENDYHIVITDLNMPNMNGMSLLERIKSRWPMIEVIVITGYATIESAIEAMKIGAH
ncbi:MAG: response regulator, partial [Aliifodinibius sp.]|nr:response regulator [Fodinibius sp.]